jgi:hypothetical protein
MKKLPPLLTFALAGVVTCAAPEQVAVSNDGDAGSQVAGDDDGSGSNGTDDGEGTDDDVSSPDDDDSPGEDVSDDDANPDDDSGGSDPLDEDDVMFGGGDPNVSAGGAGNGAGGTPGSGNGGDGTGEGGESTDGSGGREANAGSGQMGNAGAQGAGVTCSSNLDCQADEYCLDGECLADGCVAGTSYCDGAFVMSCDMWGREYSRWGDCGEGGCVEFGDFASCANTSCAPGFDFCVPGENLVRRCNDDADTSEVIEDCAASGQVCVGSACYPVVCEPGERACSESGIVTECSPQGDRMQGQGGCNSGTYCDAEAGSCVPQICPPNRDVCVDNVARVCDETGLEYLPGGVDCSAAGEVCTDGECLPVVCEAGTQFCESNGVYSCNGIGTDAEIVQNCSAVTEYCDPETVTCLPSDCTPDYAWCEENTRYLCDSLGASSQTTDCGETGQYCLDGSCQDLSCLPDSTFCDEAGGNFVRKCNAVGSSSSSYDSCSSSEYCEGAACHPIECSPNVRGCDGQRPAVCNENGSAYLPGGETCADPEYCVDAICTDALFWDGFEDGTFANWYSPSSQSEAELSSGANGSMYGIAVERIGSDRFGDGVYRTVDTLQPSAVSWWGYDVTPGGLVGYVDLISDEGESLVVVGFGSPGISVNLDPGEQPFSSGTWYPFEIRLDWVARTVDVSFDSVVIATDVPFRGSGTGIDRIELYNYDQDTRALYDEFELR